MTEQWKDFLQLGFSFFVAGYLLVVYNQTLSLLAKKLDELVMETKHTRELILTSLDSRRREDSPQQKSP